MLTPLYGALSPLGRKYGGAAASTLFNGLVFFLDNIDALPW